MVMSSGTPGEMIENRPCVRTHWRRFVRILKVPAHLGRSLCLHIIASLWFVGAAQQVAAENDCKVHLTALNWALVDGPYSELGWDRSGAALSGVACDETTINNWFEASGWRLTKAVSLTGGRYGSGTDSYLADRGLVYCLPRALLMRWRTGGCSASASVLMFEGKITWVTAGPTK